MEKGYIEVYYGDGKGKTTAAVGLAARAAGQGLRVGFYQFLKSGFSGEMVPLVKAGVQFFCPQTPKFVWEMSEAEKAACREKQQQNFERAANMAGGYDLLVLDEVLDAVETGMVDKAPVMALLADKPAGTELVLTGQKIWPELLAMADYVTEMQKKKHPYDNGLAARPGIEM